MPLIETSKRVVISDVITIIGGFILFAIFLSATLPLKADFMPSVITGFTTLTGILTAFVGFGLTHSYSGCGESTRGWMSKRILATMVFVFVGLFSAMVGLVKLAQGDLESAYRGSVVGTIIIMFVFIDVVISMSQILKSPDYQS